MNIKEAYGILEIPETATSDEAKRKFRELVKKYHPDLNKDEEASDKIKKINEAYQVVSTGKSTDREIPTPIRNPFNPFGQQFIRIKPPINLQTTISFRESVLGCKKDIKFNRDIKCNNCGGAGEIAINNGCDKCSGKGQVTETRGAMVFIQTCPKCHGRTRVESCKTCSSNGSINSETTINVTIPGGLSHGNILRLAHMGDYLASMGPLDQYSDAHLHISVYPEKDLKIEGMDVVSVMNVSLLEALQGCRRLVNTISGDQEIEIKPKSRNKDEVIIPYLGVAGRGNHKIILEVYYPDNVSEIISLLATN